MKIMESLKPRFMKFVIAISSLTVIDDLFGVDIKGSNEFANNFLHRLAIPYTHVAGKIGGLDSRFTDALILVPKKAGYDFLKAYEAYATSSGLKPRLSIEKSKYNFFKKTPGNISYLRIDDDRPAEFYHSEKEIRALFDIFGNSFLSRARAKNLESNLKAR